VDANLPWELNPALQESRLLLLAETAVEVRNKAFSEARPEEGDTNWGIGCKAHERLGHALCRLAEGGRHPWLTVHRDGLYLMPLIDGVAVRIYRGPADRPGQRHLDAVRSEHRRAQPRQMAFSFLAQQEDADVPWFWMMALETGADGKVLRAVFFQINDDGETRHPWRAPLQERPVAPPAEVAAPQETAEAPARPSRPRLPIGSAARGPSSARSQRRSRAPSLPFS
jgi:hypothetical protein